MGAILRLDPVNGSDTARADLVPSAYANNGSGLVRVTVGSLGSPAIVTGAAVLIAGTTGNVYNGRWIVTVIDSTHIDLQGSTYSSNPAAKGTAIPVGGDSWGNALQWGLVGGTKQLAGDSLRVIKSQSPLSIGSATWDGSDPGLRKTISSSTNASPIVVTLNGHGYSNGDLLAVFGHLTNTNANGVWTAANVTANTFELQGSTGNAAGSSGYVRKMNGRRIVLGAARTQLVVPDTATWTNGAGADTTWSQATWSKFGYYSSKFTMDSAVQTSIKQAYYATGTLDLSAYQNLSFWIQLSAALAGSGRLQIKLCSDTTGDTAVDTFDIPAIPGPVAALAANAQVWVRLVLPRNGGGNLGNAIKSISIWTGAVAPPNSLVFVLSNINASKTNDLDLLAMISKNSAEVGGTEPWWSIAAINGTDVYLESQQIYDFEMAANPDPAYRAAYTGASGSATTYIRHGLKLAFAASSAATALVPPSPGTNAAHVDVSGGWDSSSDTQTGMTWLDGSTSWGSPIFMGFNHFTDFSKLATVHCGSGFVPYNSRCVTGTNLAACDCSVGTNLTTCYTGSFSFDWIMQCNSGIYVGGIGYNVRVEGATEISACNYAINLLGPATETVIDSVLKSRNNASIACNFAGGIGMPGGFIVQNCELGTSVNCPTSLPYAVAYGRGVVRNCTVVGPNNTSAALGALTNLISQPSANYQILVEKELGVAGVNRIHGYFWTAVTAANTRSGGSGYQWTITALGTQLDSSTPARLPIGPIAFLANVQATVKVWVKKSHATNCVAQFVLPKLQLAGVAADVVATKASDTNWEQLSLTFTPTEQGAMMFEVRFYENGGSADSCIVADWSQT